MLSLAEFNIKCNILILKTAAVFLMLISKFYEWTGTYNFTMFSVTVCGTTVVESAIYVNVVRRLHLEMLFSAL